MTTKGFTGFPDGKVSTLQVPRLFFSELLPIIEDLGELKITLYSFWALAHKEGKVRFLRREDFLDDELLLAGFDKRPEKAVEKIKIAMEKTIARGTLLKVTVEYVAGKTDYFFLNSERGRAAVAGIESGQWLPESVAEDPVSLLRERPNVYVLYEQNIGALTPLIADDLRDAERDFPAAWIEDAIKLAVENNARSWRYVSAILDRWRSEGRDGDDNRASRSRSTGDDLPDEYRDIVKR